MRFTVFFYLCLIICVSPCWADDIRDIAPPVDFPSANYLLYLMLFILGLSAIVFLINFFIKRFKRLKPAVMKPYWVIADERLEGLRKHGFIKAGKIEEFYILLSYIIRKFLEDHLSVKVPEMTTQEFLGYLRDSSRLNSDHNGLLKKFLNSCDMVKFAKYGPSLMETEESFDIAKKLVNDLKETATLSNEGET